MQKNEEMIRVILCKPNERAQVVEIGESLEAMQTAVGGWIEEYMPFEDEVAIVCNEEGKVSQLPLNRAITDEDGQLLDIIAGDFLLLMHPITVRDFFLCHLNLRKSTWKSMNFLRLFVWEKEV